jgi:DNA/RNA-binding domain of Phe-tRNA-synthetase-like protein
VRFTYADSVRADFPELATGVLRIDGIAKTGNVSIWIAHFCDIGSCRLGNDTEGALPEIQAWRKAFGRMGLKPTQYRCASEALLRRFRKEHSLPNIHPFVDLCNAISIAFAVPVAAFDLTKISGDLEVRPANGDEVYETFAGEIEHPDAGEIIFADSSGRVHARRWANRQSGYSAVRDGTVSVLVVSEAMHAAAAEDVSRLIAAIRTATIEIWPSTICRGGERSALLKSRFCNRGSRTDCRGWGNYICLMRRERRTLLNWRPAPGPLIPPVWKGAGKLARVPELFFWC